MRNRRVYVCGLNFGYRLGIEKTTEKIISTPIEISKILSPYDVCDVAVGTSKTFFLSRKNNILGCGDGDNYQLGTGNLESNEKPKTIRSLSDLKIKQISSCGWSNLGLTDNGLIYQWGGNTSESYFRVTVPSLIPLKYELISIKCGISHAFGITKKKQLLCWGIDTCLGVNQNRNNYLPPFIHEYFENSKIKKVVTYSQTIVLTENNEIYFWGSRPKTNICVLTPTKIDVNFMVEDVAMGIHHSIFLSKTGEVFVLGSNNFQQIGLNSISKVLIPTKLKELDSHFITSISAFMFRSAFITNKGEVFVCGNNSQGQLGIGNCSKETKLTMIPSLKDVEIEKVFFEEYHTVFLERKSFFDWKEMDIFEDVIINLQIKRFF
eukprot:gene6680-10845_t